MVLAFPEQMALRNVMEFPPDHRLEPAECCPIAFSPGFEECCYVVCVRLHPAPRTSAVLGMIAEKIRKFLVIGQQF
jgi:hypothetical protein